MTTDTKTCSVTKETNDEGHKNVLQFVFVFCFFLAEGNANTFTCHHNKGLVYIRQ